MDIVILGSGNVATHLAIALKGIGQNIVQIYSPNLVNAQSLAIQVNANGIAHSAEIYKSADLYLISVKDDAISEVAHLLKNVKGLVVHTSGSTDISVFEKHVQRYGVFYPLQTFSKNKPISFGSIPICLETKDELDLVLLQNLANTLSNKVYTINGHERKVLHLAAVFACNFPNHLYALAAEILSKNGLDFDIIKPLIAETADKVMENLPIDVQTGPAVRHDEITISKHLNMLENLPQLQEIYQILSNSIKLLHK